jgi:hypothetical protein
MAGGIFADQPFAWNVKCIVFTLVLCLSYWYLPQRKLWILAILTILPYVSLAWYDHIYKCELTMQPTSLPMGRQIFLPLKPPEWRDKYETMAPEKKRFMDKVDHIATYVSALVVFWALLWHFAS